MAPKHTFKKASSFPFYNLKQNNKQTNKQKYPQQLKLSESFNFIFSKRFTLGLWMGVKMNRAAIGPLPTTPGSERSGGGAAPGVLQAAPQSRGWRSALCCSTRRSRSGRVNRAVRRSADSRLSARYGMQAPSTFDFLPYNARSLKRCTLKSVLLENRLSDVLNSSPVLTSLTLALM